MILSYVDESGINYKKVGKIFGDGPFIIWCALLIPEEKYFPLERLFYQLIKKKLKVKNWEESELHATDIWARDKEFSALSEKAAREYFAELAQLLKKLDIKIVVGAKKKSKNLRSAVSKDMEIKKAIYSFLHGLEHQVSEINETTVVIADKSSEGNKLSLLEEVYFDKTKWRYNPDAKKTQLVKSKFLFESMSCFLLDQVHHTDSSKSLFLQIADNATFLIRKVFEQAYYTYNTASTGITADPKKVPIDFEDFLWLAGNITLTSFSEKKKDVLFTDLSGAALSNNNYISAQIINSIE